MAEDLTDAKRDDAADLLDVVAKNRKVARGIVRPGMPELLNLFAAGSCGRIASWSREGSFSRGLLILGAVALVADAAYLFTRRGRFGVEVNFVDGFWAGVLFWTTVLLGRQLHGDDRQLVLAISFIGCALAVAAIRRTWLLVVAAAIVGILTAAQAWPLVVATPLLIGCAVAGWTSAERVYNRGTTK